MKKFKTYKEVVELYIYITSGTMDFMESLRQKYKNENMIAMHGKGNSLLIHETTERSTFQTPMKYDVIGSTGTFKEEGFFALNHISVTDEGRPIFEHWLLSHIDPLENESGFIAYRLLRPVSSNTFIILTQWTKKIFFDLWQESISYQKILPLNEVGTGLEKKPHMFTSAPYTTTYKAKKEE